MPTLPTCGFSTAVLSRHPQVFASDLRAFACDMSEDNFNNTIKLAHELGKHVVVAGCVPQAQPHGKYFDSLSIVGVCDTED
jgi:collagenase-like PrtC family protease